MDQTEDSENFLHLGHYLMNYISRNIPDLKNTFPSLKAKKHGSRNPLYGHVLDRKRAGKIPIANQSVFLSIFV